MTKVELIAEFRQIAQDAAGPYYLFPDESVTRWLADAESEACIRARLIHEAEDEDVCVIALEGGASTYPLHSSLYEIDHISYRPAGSIARAPVRLTSTEELDRTVRDWRDLTGTPEYAIQSDQSIRFVPRPVNAGEILLEGYRIPLKSLITATKPEINSIHHRHLVHWALHRAFSTPDPEILDMGRADAAERAFTEYFGKRPDVDLRRKVREDEVQTNKVFWA